MKRKLSEVLKLFKTEIDAKAQRRIINNSSAKQEEAESCAGEDRHYAKYEVGVSNHLRRFAEGMSE